MSKYASLPDIDTAPDVYETEDVPYSSSGRRRGDNDDDSDDDAAAGRTRGGGLQTMTNSSEEIDQSSTLGVDAVSRRFGAVASKTYTLYPSTLPRTRPTVSSTSIASTSLIAEPEASLVEPPRARLRRLRYEMEELEEQLKQEALEGKGADGNEGTGAVASEGMLRQLQGLRVGLGKLEASKMDGSGAVQEGWEGRLKRLRAPAAAPAPAKVEELASPSNASSDDRKAAELDRRLAALEQTIGVGSVTGDSADFPSGPLLPTVQKLDHLLTLLTQPRHLDAISRRIKLLLTDLDRAHQTGGAPNKDHRRSLVAGGLAEAESKPLSAANQAQTTRVDALFAVLPRLEPLLPVLPHLLTRLRSLSDLHASASEFSTTLSTVEREVGGLRDSVPEAKAVLEQLEKAMRENEALTKGNLEALGGRIEEVGRRLEALGR